jgi:hypothetical protein
MNQEAYNEWYVKHLAMLAAFRAYKESLLKGS